MEVIIALVSLQWGQPKPVVKSEIGRKTTDPGLHGSLSQPKRQLTIIFL